MAFNGRGLKLAGSFCEHLPEGFFRLFIKVFFLKKINLSLSLVVLHHNYFFFSFFFPPLFSAILNKEGWVTQPKYIWKYSCKHKPVIYYIGIYNSFWLRMCSRMRIYAMTTWILVLAFVLWVRFFTVVSWKHLNTKAKTAAQGVKSANNFFKKLLLWVDCSLKAHMPCFG